MNEAPVATRNIDAPRWWFYLPKTCPGWRAGFRRGSDEWGRLTVLIGSNATGWIVVAVGKPVHEAYGDEDPPEPVRDEERDQSVTVMGDLRVSHIGRNILLHGEPPRELTFLGARMTREASDVLLACFSVMSDGHMTLEWIGLDCRCELVSEVSHD